jgi:DNA (cytosine-5)-methyltransferase 1
MNVGSLFSGVGGLELALESFGHTTLWQVEIDPYARGVLEHHWPHVQRFTDARTVGAAELRAVDVVCGGFPCQDISNAGTRAGIDGERSGLWREFARGA